MKISVSYLKNNDGNEKTILKINQTSASFLHVDLMDGIFVNNKNFTIDTLDYLSLSNKPLDVHLMVDDPYLYIDKLLSFNLEYVTIHVEARNILKTIARLKKENIKVGIAIRPSTPIKYLEPLLRDIDLVLVLSVNPGEGGQEFMIESIGRLEALKELQNQYSFLISVDGGINDKTIKLVKNYVDIAVSGSFICMSSNFEEKVNLLKN